MDILEAINCRHSVRQYQEKNIEKEKIYALEKIIDDCNSQSGLKFQLVINDKKAFKGLKAHYGHFENVNSYIALVGKIEEDLEEKVGYFGEYCLLEAQKMGLNSCWIVLTFNKRNVIKICKVLKGEKLVAIIALGYGTSEGREHISKSMSELSNIASDSPSWFVKGVECASKAPTALNRQSFYIELLENNNVRLKSLGGKYAKIDYGIVKYHFEVGAGKENFNWVD